MDHRHHAFQEKGAIKLERLELALKASNEGIWDWRTHQSEIYYSRRILEFFECGDKHAPNLFLSPESCVHPEDLPLFKQTLEKTLAHCGPEILAIDTRIQTGSGEWRWLRIRGTVLRDRKGVAFRIAGSIIDISKRKQAEAQVEEERFLLRQLIDHVPLQIYFKDLNSIFVLANQGSAEWMGLEKDSDIIGKHDRDFFDPAHWLDTQKDEQQIIQTGIPITNLLEHETWNQGNETWVLSSKFPWKDRHGTLKGTFGVSSDVTKLVTAQKEATELAQQLQEKNKNYEEELHLAREVQQALTNHNPPTLTTSRFKAHFASRYVPISGLAGDFFEIIQIRDDCAGILICDVMGHGIRSALIVAMLRGLLEKQHSQASDPSTFLQGLNEGLASILERAHTTMFATAFYGVVDLSAGTLSYACAGHPGPIINGPDGPKQIATKKNEKGPGLGLFRHIKYPVNTLPLSSIYRMILFTDGVLEAENQLGEPFFEKRLIDIIGATTTETLDTTLDAILSNVLSFSESLQFDDDVCLLGLNLESLSPPSL